MEAACEQQVLSHSPMGRDFERIEYLHRTRSSHNGHLIPTNRPWPGHTRHIRGDRFQRLERRVHLRPSDLNVLLLGNL